VFRTFSLNADIGVGVTLWVGVFLNWPFSESVQSDASLTTDPHLFNRVCCVYLPRSILSVVSKRKARHLLFEIGFRCSCVNKNVVFVSVVVAESIVVSWRCFMSHEVLNE